MGNIEFGFLLELKNVHTAAVGEDGEEFIFGFVELVMLEVFTVFVLDEVLRKEFGVFVEEVNDVLGGGYRVCAAFLEKFNAAEAVFTIDVAGNDEYFPTLLKGVICGN